jgi:hypothetical protein
MPIARITNLCNVFGYENHEMMTLASRTARAASSSLAPRGPFVPRQENSKMLVSAFVVQGIQHG